MTEIWTQWEREVINGTFPLRSLLGSSDRSAVFLTEYPAQGITDAAIKIVATDLEPGLSQLVRWEAAMDLPHPHLLPLFECGLCQRAGRNFEFLVMEYAEETLAEILPIRALTAEEVQAMLHPTLQALGFLHSQDFVHGGLKPANFLVVGDQLKLASDTIHAVGESTAAATQPSPYDPPEGPGGRFPMAADMWALGVTMVEALTQRAPVWSESATVIPALPDETPSLLSKAVRRCLHRSPAARPSAADLDALLRGVAQSPLASASEPEPKSMTPPALPGATIGNPVAVSGAAPAASAVSAAPTPAAPVATPVVVAAPPKASAPSVRAPRGTPVRKRSLPLIAALLILAIIAAALLHALRSVRHPPESATPTPMAPISGAPDTSVSNATPAPPPPSIAPAPLGTPEPRASPREPKSAIQPPDAASQTTAEASYVRHLELPVVSRNATETIHGHFGVAVRVTFDTAGNVIDATLEQAGPSQYFARRAMVAARQWRFVRADTPGTRQSLLWFEFSRDGVTAHAEAPSTPTP